ncbi:MAG: SpaA isopeptide-forming pilin-related protein [Bifidobacterium angulatum]|uniref:SpaA isopeptide-forming pilin-related protein n=1 Tax=Bifidobacterium angulatum TaxID=1683 RepID=UPI0039910901
MRHQVERLKHVALKHGVKPARALTATLVAVGMMVTGSVVLGSSTANADGGHNNGAICTPTTEPLGDQTSGSGNDEGIATFVGGDMYVGGKKSGITSANNNNAPEGSYAVEAEGLTAVNGKLLLHPMKQAWNIWNKDGSFNRSRGFRWGIVGFGSQFRPKDDSTVLSVGGNSTNSELNWFGGAQGWTDNANQGSSWLGTGAGNSATGETNDHNFNANIAGNQTTVQSRNGWKNGEQYSVYAMGGNGKVNWNHSNTVISGVKNPSTGSDYTYSDYKNYVATLSGKLAKIASSNTVTRGNEDNYTGSRYSYSYNTYEHNVYRFDIQNNSRQTEITLTGNGKDELQVFNLDASMLNSIGDAGVVFNFKNISDNASVAVNINGNGNDVKFRNGWQFKWNGVDISDGYVMMNSTGENRYNNTHGQEYVKRASQLMWNFYNTDSLTILGGKGSGHINTGWYKNQNHGDKEDWYNVNVTDDPSAAWMGSVMVTGNDSGAAGNFQSHVSTNGRVWTTGDFEMYNKDVVTTDNGNFVNSEGKYSTSAVDMDQERHNLSWYGQMTTSCAAIAWDKVDDTAGHNALGGTSWTVYGKKEDAVNGTNALATIADGGWNDDADAEGSIQLGNLAKNGTYFLKESGTAEGYAQNTNIYQINTGGTTDAAKNIVHVFNSTGIEITAEADKLLTDGKIINKKTGSAIEWQKVDGTDNSTLLAGSTWTLSKMNGDTASEEWAITDDQSGTEVKSVKIFDANNNEVASASFTNSTAQQFHAVAYDQNGTPIDNAKLTWSSADSAVAAVSENGLVTPTGSGNTTITVKSADGNVTASFTVEVSGVTVETSVSISGYTNGQEISLEKGKTRNLIASVAPEGNTVTWSTSNADNVSLSANTGKNVTLTANKVTSSPVTITAKETRTSKTVTLRVNVTKPPATTTTVFFKIQGDFNQDNRQKLFLEWKTANGNWPSDSGDPPNRKEMTVASGCNGYVSYTINEVMPTSASFRIRRDKAGWTTPESFYRPDANSGFAFKGGDVVTLNTSSDILDTAPSGCAVTSTAAYSSRRVAARSGEHRAVASVLRTQSNVVNVLENSTVSSKKDEDTKAGKFKVSDLADGTYHLQEKTAPNGYEVSDTVYTITIKNGAATWNPALDSYKLPNTRKTGTVKWNKVSSEYNTEFLSGSEWKLYKTKNFTWNNGNAEYTEGDSITPIATITDCVNSSEKTCSAQTEQYTDRNGEAGKFELVGLAWGEYQLVESKAPDGYNIDKTPHTFRIGPAEGSDVTGKWYTSSGFKTDSTDVYNANTAFTVDGGSITNTPGVVLPGTGGEGLNKMYAAGFLAVAIAVAGLALSLRRRQ